MGLQTPQQEQKLVNPNLKSQTRKSKQQSAECQSPSARRNDISFNTHPLVTEINNRGTTTFRKAEYTKLQKPCLPIW